MHEACGKRDVVRGGLLEMQSRLKDNSPELRAHVSAVIGSVDGAALDAKVATMSARVGTALGQIDSEAVHQDIHYVSRFDSVGLFQSVLSKVFNDVPDLQGYGDENPSWVTTLVEALLHDTKVFFERVYEDSRGRNQTVWKALITELVQLPDMDFRAPFPPGTPVAQLLPENTPIVLLGDWGGDNGAAKNVAEVARRQKPSIGIHLGDVYYGGTKSECESFLRLWPLLPPGADPSTGSPRGSSWALNGNHEMYCGGEYYFNVVMKAFNQPQSFFCLENKYWRIIGLDTAYANGSLQPSSSDDPIAVQWNWLLELLKDGSGRANIFLTHHQPVSAHKQEWQDSQKLRTEIDDILATPGVPKDAIFGWFFGHEHRCAIYENEAAPYNARLIGNGCIPHLVQTEKEEDAGCTPFSFINRLPTSPGSEAAVSSFAVLTFSGADLVINYYDENYSTLGVERWNATSGRFGGDRFQEYDGLTQGAR